MAVPSNSGSQNQPPVGRISVLRDKAGLDVLSMYPVNSDYTPGADALDVGCASEGGRGLSEGGHAVRTRAVERRRLRRFLRRAVRRLWRRPGRCQGQRHRALGRSAAGAGIWPATGEVPAARRAELRQRFEQPCADLRAERADLQPALRLGGGEARPAAGGAATAGRSPRRADRRDGSSPTIRISGRSGRSAATSPRRRTCWNISASASRWRNAPRRCRASTSRRSTACWTSPSGTRSSRRVGTVYHYPIRPSHHARPHVAGHAGRAGDRHADLQPRHAAGDAGEAVHRPVDSAGRSPGRKRSWRASCAEGAVR